MKRLVIFAALVALISACGPDNPFGTDNPSPSALTGVAGSSTTAELDWTAVSDADFTNYTLYRSASPDIRNNVSSATILIVVEDRNTTSYDDENLNPGSLWYYALRVANESGGITWSNEVSVQLPSSRVVGQLDK